MEYIYKICFLHLFTAIITNFVLVEGMSSEGAAKVLNISNI